MMDSATIDDLPPEILCLIFKRLSLNDLVELKWTCRLWYDLIASLRIERLYVTESANGHEHWHHSNRPCRESEYCDFELFLSEFENLSNLKYLKLSEPFDQMTKQSIISYLMNDVNWLQQLVQLDLRNLHQIEELHLQLANLEVFALGCPNLSCQIYLDCPKLRVLRYSEHTIPNLLRVEHPQSLRTLDSSMSGDQLTRFTNLECLKRSNCNEEKILDRSTLLALDKLTTVHYLVDPRHLEFDRLDALKPALQELMKLKRRLGRSDLKIYFAGLLLVADDLSDIDFGSRNENYIATEPLYMKHYNRLQTDMHFIWIVNYNRLFSSVSALPDDYFKRFSNLCFVQATWPFDEQHCLKFLRNIPHLKSLTLYINDLSQRFLNSLVEFGSLTDFYLYQSDGKENDGKEDEKDVVLRDFSFVDKFTKLSWLRIDMRLSPASIESVLIAFGSPSLTDYQRRCYFRFGRHEFQVIKRQPLLYEEDERFDLMINWSNTLLDDVPLQGLLDYFKKSG